MTAFSPSQREAFRASAALVRRVRVVDGEDPPGASELAIAVAFHLRQAGFSVDVVDGVVSGGGHPAFFDHRWLYLPDVPSGAILDVCSWWSLPPVQLHAVRGRDGGVRDWYQPCGTDRRPWGSRSSGLRLATSWLQVHRLVEEMDPVAALSHGERDLALVGSAVSVPENDRFGVQRS